MRNYIIGVMNSEARDVINDIRKISTDNICKALDSFIESQNESITRDDIVVMGEKCEGCIILNPEIGQYYMSYILKEFRDENDYIVISPTIVVDDNDINN